jgi:hypothetical protein
MTQRDADKHQAGGPGKSAKKGHIDPDQHNKPGQKQTPHERGVGGEGGTRGVPPEKQRDSG